MNWILKIKNRLGEPSTMAGLSVLATVFFHVPTNTVELVTKAVTAVFGALAVLIPEKSN